MRLNGKSSQTLITDELLAAKLTPDVISKITTTE